MLSNIVLSNPITYIQASFSHYVYVAEVMTGFIHAIVWKYIEYIYIYINIYIYIYIYVNKASYNK